MGLEAAAEGRRYGVHDGAGQGGRCGRSGLLTRGWDIRQSECATVYQAEFQDPDRPRSQLPTAKSSRDSADVAEDLGPRGDPNAPSALTGIRIHRSPGSFPAAVGGGSLWPCGL